MSKQSKRARQRARLNSTVKAAVAKHIIQPDSSNGWEPPTPEEVDGLPAAFVLTLFGMGVPLLPVAIAMKLMA